MNQQEIAELIFAKDTKEALAGFRQFEADCAESDALYPYFDLYLSALDNEKSCTRARGFKAVMYHAKWDRDNQIAAHLEQVLSVLDDEKATIVRQCLPLLCHIGEYRKELIPAVREKLVKLDYLKYKESMQGLIYRDIQTVLRALNDAEKE